MNLGVFNRMNSNQKEDIKVSQEKMYCDWSSFCSSIQNNQVQDKFVLGKLPLSPEAAKQIVTLVVQPIAANIGINLPTPLLKLNTDKEVNWCMEVFGYGLSLPLSEHDTIRDCVHVYCEWLSALLPQPKSSVPLPLLKLPNYFSRKIIAHLYHLFVPRPGDAAPDVISRQALLCHRVLRTFQNVVLQSSILDQDTWDCLLLFLLAINDSLLAPPTIPNDIGDQLCDRVLSVLLEVWLQACSRSFPSPRMWKTLTDLAQTWRHRTSLISQWNRINVALTSRLLRDLYGPLFPNFNIYDDEKVLVPLELTGELLAQTWYRLLHCIGNPVQLARPSVISQTHKFLQYAIMSSQLSDPSQHPCLAFLPNIFVEAMKGIAILVDTFLGVPASSSSSYGRIDSRSTSGSSGSRRLGPTDTTSNSSFSGLTPYRARCNSLLHLFGSWLFEAALLDCDSPSNTKASASDARLPSPLMVDRSRASSVSVASETSAPSNRPRSATVIDQLPDSSSVSISSDGYENGRAEALGALCRIFSSKKTDEDILPQYLARFFVVLHHGLKIKEDKVVSETTASVLLHSADLLRVDLDGIFTVLPSFVDALEIVLSAKEIRVRPNVNRVELRRASIHVLLSILAVPLHFHQLQIKDLASCIGDRNSTITFSQLRPRLTHLLLSALQVETDSFNTHLLLGGLATFIHDQAAYEQTEHISQQSHEYFSGQMQLDAASTIISSTSDTHSCHSTSSTSYPSISEITMDSHHDHDVSFTEKSSFIGSTLPSPLWSFHGLVSAAIHIVSYKLLSIWKADLNTSLAAVEMLGSLAKIRVADQSVGESRRVVRVLCEYISLQCSRPPPAHSKDLHSTIVAAFTCCASWLFAHPYLAADNDCLHGVLQVVELGISGSKSQGKVGEYTQMKHLKDLKPVSLRVRDAAELLLTSLIEQVGNFPTPCGAHSLSCLLEENSLFHQSPLGKEKFKPEILPSAIKHFRYFATSDGGILSVLEQPLGNDQDPQPNVTFLLRNAFGRQVWTSQLRHLPRHKCGVRSQNLNPGRPLPMSDIGMEPIYEPQYFPDSVDRVRPCLADKSIQNLDTSLSVDDRFASELDKLGRLVDGSTAKKGMDIDSESEGKLEYQPPVLCNEFQTARLFLSHLGFLSLESLQEMSMRGNSLVGLDSNSPGFSEELENIDRLGSRTHDSVHVFYVRSGQKSAEEILSNVAPTSLLDAHFLEFLLTLGWPVSVKKHHGWAGSSINNPNKVFGGSAEESSILKEDIESNVEENLFSDQGRNVYDGNSRVLYWADGFGEIVFIVPTRILSSSSSPSPPFHRSSPQRQSIRKSYGNEEVEQPKRKRTVRQTAQANNSELKIIVVWLESFEDHLNFPLGELLGGSTTDSQDTGHVGSNRVEEQENDCFIIFIHAQQTGLYRIHLQGPQSRINFATPLVEGTVVSRRVLGSLVRATSLNMAKRRRLDQESYQLPHVRRKFKISEFASRYRSELETPSFYSSLFSDPGI